MHRFHDQSTAGKLSRGNLFRLGAGGALAASVSACASLDRGPAVPLGRTKEASVLGLPNERFFPATGFGPLEQEFNQAVTRLTATRCLNSPLDLPQLQLLAISGGGENGAFGAGLLCGWTEQGTRPEFELVTGISTGALTAPFAYLGPAYDAQLRSVYTELEPKQVLISRFVTAAVWDDAMADNSPLFHTISRHLDDRMLADIAMAYDSGRLLLIASTHLDAQQPVIWNIGAIAKSGHPKAANTIRRVLLASAAIPGAFPPTMFEVTLDGKALPGNARRRGRLRPDLPLSSLALSQPQKAHAGKVARPETRCLYHPQRTPRRRVGHCRAAHIRYRQPGDFHHDYVSRLQRSG